MREGEPKNLAPLVASQSFQLLVPTSVKHQVERKAQRTL